MKKYIVIDNVNYPLAICDTPEEAAALVGKLALERAVEATAVHEKHLAVIVHERSALPGGGR